MHQRQDGDHAVVAVGLDEVVSGDGRGVDVVLSEWADEGLAWGEEEGDRARLETPNSTCWFALATGDCGIAGL